VFRRTSIAAALACVASLLMSGCSSRVQRADECPGRARALSAAVRALAVSGDAEAPRGIVAGFDVDPVCPAGGFARRVRCHLARPTVDVTSQCRDGAWLFTIWLPELSDHVHRARVWGSPGGALAVRVDSEN
jgi:outer membrane murein-binding lipoprotein Lpp